MATIIMTGEDLVLGHTVIIDGFQGVVTDFGYAWEMGKDDIKNVLYKATVVVESSDDIRHYDIKQLFTVIRPALKIVRYPGEDRLKMDGQHMQELIELDLVGEHSTLQHLMSVGY